MKQFLVCSLLLLSLISTALGQGVSCPAVVASPDTTLNCNDCVLLRAQPVSGFQTTSYTLQQIPYNPYPYNAGTQVLIGIDDIWTGILPLGFNFCFYGASYNQCVVGSNGVLSFDLTYANQYCAWPIGQGIPGNTDVLNSILGPFHDIDPSVGGNVYWAQYGAAPCRVFVLSFYNIPMFDCNNLIATQQIVLYETTNIIEVYIQNKPTCSSWNGGYAIEGIQDASGTQAVVVPGRNYPSVWNTSNEAYAFVPAGAQNYTVTWYEVGNAVPLTTMDTITVCPPGNRDYYAEVVYTNCDGATVTVRDTASINASTSNMVLTTSGTNVSCNGGTNGSATVTVTGNTNPYTISWSTGANSATISNLAAGSYTVTVTETGGCSNTASVIITEPSAISLQVQSTHNLCNGQANGTATVSAGGGTGPYTYLWSNSGNTSTITGLPAGTYSVTVTDAGGCTATISASVNEPPALQLGASGTDVICAGGGNGTATAVASGGTSPYSYLWNTGATSAGIANLQAGTYSVTATDANGCALSASVTINEPAPIGLQITGDNVLCSYDSVRLTPVIAGGVAPYSYQWWSVPAAVNDTNEVLVYIAGETRTYHLQVVDQNGCTFSGSYEVLAYPAPIIDFVPDQRQACDSATILFINNSTPTDAGWHWEFSDGTTSNGMSPEHWFGNGIWSATLTATSNEGCVSTLLQQDIIEIIPTPQASFVSDPDIRTLDFVLLSEATFTFNNTSPWYATAVNWSFGNGDSAFVGQVVYTFPDTGYYCVTMTAYNNFGCHTDSSQCILILPDPSIWIPTGFTPNGDGLNDFFQIGGIEIKTFDITIFDRWGRLIYHSESMGESWDGRIMGEEGAEGVYTYKVDAVNNLGQHLQRAGTVTLIR